MFADFSGSDSWFLAPGRLADGENVEVLRRGPLDSRKPVDVQSALRGFRWTMYFYNVIKRGADDPAFQATHPALLDYLCREWDADNPPARRLESVSLVMVTEPMPRPGLPPPPPGRPLLLATRVCGPGGRRPRSAPPAESGDGAAGGT
jgi:hypothetical protein